MTALFVALLASLRAAIRSRLELVAEVLALRHQLAVLQRTTPRRPRLRSVDRLVWVLLSSVWPNWRPGHADRDARHRRSLASARVRCLLADVLTAPRAPWQNPYVERVIGSLRRRVSRSCHCVKRALIAAPPATLHRLLSRLAHSPLAGQGCARAAS